MRDVLNTDKGEFKTLPILYTMAEVAEMLNIKRRTLYNYVYSGKLNHVRIGREYRVSAADIRRFLAEEASSEIIHKASKEA